MSLFKLTLFVAAESSRKSALVNWYLNEIQDEIESEQELTEKKLMVERVINRLIYQVSFHSLRILQVQFETVDFLFQDQVIIPLSRTGLAGKEEVAEDEDPLLVVHPNYVLE